MKPEKISECIGLINDKYIDEATLFEFDRSNEDSSVYFETARISAKKKHRFKIIAAAACLVLTMVVSLSWVVIAEAVEYKTALDYFEKNGLSTEGLSRSDIKAVYHDIITKSFTYGKTADVLKKSAYVSGLELELPDKSSAEVSGEVSEKDYSSRDNNGNGIILQADNQDIFNDEGAKISQESIVSCYKDDELLWTKEIPDTHILIDSYLYTDDGLVFYGMNIVWSSIYDNTTKFYIGFIDNEGTIEWGIVPDHGFQYENISSVLDNGDGTIAVISEGDNNFLCLSLYDKNGNETCFKKNDIGSHTIYKASHFKDDYIIYGVMNRDETEYFILKIDREGNISDDFINSYETEDMKYSIDDMTECGGQLYLSADALPKDYWNENNEFAEISEYFNAHETSDYYIPDDVLTTIVEKYNNAVLLVCDTESGEPKRFYSVSGACTGKLSVNDNGEMEWEVAKIISTYFSPYTSSHSIGGKCRVHRYVFDTNGVLIRQEDTGEILPFVR